MPPIISKIVVSGYENIKLVENDNEIYVTKEKTIEEIYYPNMNKTIQNIILDNDNNIVPDIADLIVQFSHCDIIDIIRKGQVKKVVSSKCGSKMLKKFKNLYDITVPNNNLTLFINDNILDLILHKDDENVIINKILIETTRTEKSSRKITRAIEMTKDININIRSKDKPSDLPFSYWDLTLIPANKWNFMKYPKKHKHKPKPHKYPVKLQNFNKFKNLLII